MNISISIKFALLAFLLAGTGILFSSYYTYKDAANLLKQQNLYRLAEDLERQTLRFGQNIDRIRSDVDAIGRSELVNGYYRAVKSGGYDDVRNMTTELWEERIALDLSALLRQRPAYLQARFIGAANNGKEIVRVERAGDKIITTPANQLQQKGKRLYVKRTLQLQPNQQYLSPIELNEEFDKIVFPLQPVVRVAAPVYYQDKVHGIIIINADFNELSKLFQSPPEQVSYFIANPKGDYLFHPEHDKQFQLAQGNQPGLLQDYGKFNLIEKSADKGYQINVLPEQSSNLITFHHELTPNNPDNYLIVGSIASHSLIEQDAAEFLQRMFINVFIVVIILSIAMALLSKYLLAPISALTNTANRIAQGDKTVQFPSTATNDELGILTHSFSTMYNHLDESQHQLTQLAGDLEKQVKERTKELESAVEKAELSAKVKSEFLAAMSHEIRTPMNGVLGMLGLLLNSNMNNDQQQKAALAQSSAQHLLQLLNDILDFSKVDAGHLHLESLDFDLCQMLGEFAKFMATQAQAKDLELVLDIQDAEDIWVKGDPSRLRQILTNLVGNAIKFTTLGEVTIVADVAWHESQQQWQLRIHVSDTGIGIPKHKQAHLFELFTQVDASTTRRFGGTGLGLAVAKKLCELMGGGIGLVSQENQGSCFTASILLDKSDTTALPTPSFSLQSKQILIVDDNQANQTTLERQLTFWDGQITTANTASKALEILNKLDANQSFDIILVDMHMPDTDGIALCKQIRQEQKFNASKLILMTSMAYQTDEDFLTQTGIDGYCSKPATIEDLKTNLSTTDRLKSPQIQNDQTPNEDSLEPSSSAPAWPADTHILLVEDNFINQMVATGILKELNIVPDVAANGIEALALLEKSTPEKPYTLILMDCQMPQMDGYETTGKIRANEYGEHYRDAPIIALTANTMEGDREICLEAGMSDYLGKPIAPPDLAAMLEKWLVNSK